MKKLVAIALAILAAYWAGPYMASSFYQDSHDPETAKLYSYGILFLLAWAIAYFWLLNIPGEFWVTVAFAAFAAYEYGTSFGYYFFIAHDKGTAAFYGGLSVFMGASVVGCFMVWPIVRHVFNGLFSDLSRLDPRRIAQRNRSHNVKIAQGAMSVAELETQIEQGDTLEYKGRIDRDYEYTDGRLITQRGRCAFELTRNTMTMPPREREAVLLFRVFHSRNLLSPAGANQINFALAWGDGRCRCSGGPITVSRLVFKEYGFKSLYDFIAYEAAQHNATVEGALSELFGLLQDLARQPNPHPDVLMLYQRYAPPTQPVSKDTFH